MYWEVLVGEGRLDLEEGVLVEERAEQECK